MPFVKAGISAGMFKRSLASRDRAGKSSRPKRSFRDPAKLKPILESQKLESPPLGSTLMSSIVTITVGKEQRLFAAHEDVLSMSPYFAAACRGAFLEAHSRRIDLPDEEPEIFSCVLEYLYKGDYFPAMVYSKRRDVWELEDGAGSAESVVFHSGVDGVLLKDTVIYCAADRYGLDELKRLSLRKQGLHSGIEVGTVLRSARYAYGNTPDSDSHLRAHYLALIIRCRKIFKRSGTMQMEMEIGGKLFFDLFVSLCNHVDDVAEMAYVRAIPPSFALSLVIRASDRLLIQISCHSSAKSSPRFI